MLRVGVVERNTVLDGARKGNYTGITVTVLLSRVQEPWDRSYRMGAVEIHRSRGNSRRQNQHLEAGKCGWFGLLRVSPFASDTPDPMACPLWAWQFTTETGRVLQHFFQYHVFHRFHTFWISLVFGETITRITRRLLERTRSFLPCRRMESVAFYDNRIHLQYRILWNSTYIYTSCVLFTTQTDSNSQRLLRCLRWEPSTLSEWRHGVQKSPHILPVRGWSYGAVNSAIFEYYTKVVGTSASLSTVRAFLGVSYKTSRTLSTLDHFSNTCLEPRASGILYNSLIAKRHAGRQNTSVDCLSDTLLL
jgi:hypothetical protein